MRVRPRSATPVRRILAVAAVASGIAFAAVEGNGEPGPAPEPRLYTNESYVEDVQRAGALVLSDPLSVFAFVLRNLPRRVTVYPTENYYYFGFYHDGVRYAGNIRLDVMDRDAGKLHFAYFEDLAEWKDEESVSYQVLDRSHGVSIEKIEDLTYRVSHAGQSVVFALNDLRGVHPPPGALGPEEKYIGPVFDESGLRFFLIYNPGLKIFHYVLDESAPASEQFVDSAAVDRISIGRRTGFAFYKDHRLDRKILVGVFEGNARVNNYFDGPFDQLPDNFVEGETLRAAILEIAPDLDGRIDRLGSSPDGKDRYLIAPYAHYRLEEDLALFHECATSPDIPYEAYYACFVIDRGEPPMEDDEGAAVLNGSPAQPGPAAEAGSLPLPR